MNVFYVDGEFVAEDQAVIFSERHRGAPGLRGFRLPAHLQHAPLFIWRDHIRRLETSARLIDLAMPGTPQEIFDITMEALSRNKGHLDEANIRLVITGGISPDAITPQNHTKLLVMVTPIHPCPAEWYRDGAAIITTHDERYIPGAKSTNYIPAILALSRARRQNAAESIYVDRVPPHSGRHNLKFLRLYRGPAGWTPRRIHSSRHHPAGGVAAGPG